MQGSWETGASPEGGGLPMMVLVSLGKQFAGLSHRECRGRGNFGLTEGAGLPMMVVVSWEMQGSVIGHAGLIGNLGLTRC